MIEPTAQGAEATLDELLPVLPLIYRALEGAVQQGREFFGDNEIDRPLFPNLVRYHVKLALNKRGLTVVDDNEPHLDHKILANNGLLLEYGPRHVRILKADHGALPAPGISRTKQQFYEQLSLLEEPIDTQKLILLWDVEGGVLDLQLVCPKSGSERTSSAHWMIPVPHPAEIIETDAPQEAAFEFDLPISLPQAATDDE